MTSTPDTMERIAAQLRKDGRAWRGETEGMMRAIADSFGRVARDLRAAEQSPTAGHEVRFGPDAREPTTQEIKEQAAALLADVSPQDGGPSPHLYIYSWPRGNCAACGLRSTDPIHTSAPAAESDGVKEVGIPADATNTDSTALSAPVVAAGPSLSSPPLPPRKEGSDAKRNGETPSQAPGESPVDVPVLGSPAASLSQPPAGCGWRNPPGWCLYIECRKDQGPCTGLIAGVDYHPSSAQATTTSGPHEPAPTSRDSEVTREPWPAGSRPRPAAGHDDGGNSERSDQPAYGKPDGSDSHSGSSTPSPAPQDAVSYTPGAVYGARADIEVSVTATPQDGGAIIREAESWARILDDVVAPGGDGSTITLEGCAQLRDFCKAIAAWNRRVATPAPVGGPRLTQLIGALQAESKLRHNWAPAISPLLDATVAELSRLSSEVERLTRERDEAITRGKECCEAYGRDTMSLARERNAANERAEAAEAEVARLKSAMTNDETGEVGWIGLRDYAVALARAQKVVEAADELYSAVADVLDAGIGNSNFHRLKDARSEYATASNVYRAGAPTDTGSTGGTRVTAADGATEGGKR